MVNEECDLSSRARFLDGTLLILAILGPAFHLAGIWTRGLTLLYSDYGRLAVTYGILAASAGVSAYLTLKEGQFLIRLVAAIVLVVNLGSIAYAASAWSREMNHSVTDVTAEPIESGMIGILVAQADSSNAAIARSREIESTLQGIVDHNGLTPFVHIRRIYPITSLDRAHRAGRNQRANIVVWEDDRDGSPLEGVFHVTVLGAHETMVELDAVNLLMLLATQTDLSVAYGHGTGADQAITEVVAPVAAGMGAFALGRPRIGGAQFDRALDAPFASTELQQSLHNLLGTSKLLAKRPDLAAQDHAVAGQLGPCANAWVGLGTVAIAQRDWVRARQCFRTALVLDPYNVSAYCGIGVLRARDRDVASALASYRQAATLSTSWGVPYAFLGMGYELLADIESARAAYQQCAMEAGPNVGLQVAAHKRAEDVVRHPPTAVPTATPPPLPTATPVPTESMYTVEKGDTLQAIAIKFETTVEELVKANELDNPNAISVGQILLIPNKRR